MLNRARTLSFGGRGGWVSPHPQPSGKTDELAAMIQILRQFHSIGALKASPAGRTDTPPGAWRGRTEDGAGPAIARNTSGFRPLRTTRDPGAAGRADRCREQRFLPASLGENRL